MFRSHFLKQRIGNHTRMGGPTSFRVEAIVEAAESPESNLTFSALTGQRKQSIGDVERLFNPDLVTYLEKKGYEYEAQYIRVVSNWRRASDERGLSQQVRTTYNQEFLKFILDELMPWHLSGHDYSTLEVNRLVLYNAHLCNYELCNN